jgi:peptidoglycan/LPS O-acetylase OafA/YrhL
MDADTQTRKFHDAFDPRSNSLNFLRLALALTVVAAHAFGLGLFGKDWVTDKTTVGDLAVYGFFGISGFLITRLFAQIAEAELHDD